MGFLILESNLTTKEKPITTMLVKDYRKATHKYTHTGKTLEFNAAN